MHDIGVADAAMNNAAWCDAMCSAHGSPGHFFDSHWVTRAPAPPLHPDLVTFDSAPGPAMAAIRELDRARPSGSWAVKDSFGALPLAQSGFRLLFGAEWIARPPLTRRSGRGSPDRRWLRVRSESALSAWEAAWGGSAEQPRLFLPALLARREIAILAAVDESGAITAGVVANRADDAVGLTNFFEHGRSDGSARAECVDAAGDAFPGLAMVGYESGHSLAECHALGFVSIGSLQVWVRSHAHGRSTVNA